MKHVTKYKPFSFCATGVRCGRGEHAVSIIIISLQKLFSLHLGKNE